MAALDLNASRCHLDVVLGVLGLVVEDDLTGVGEHRTTRHFALEGLTLRSHTVNVLPRTHTTMKLRLALRSIAAIVSSSAPMCFGGRSRIIQRSSTVFPVARKLAVLLFISFSLPALRAEEAKVEKPKGHPTKRIWAHDLLWTDAPKLEVGEWLTKEPELEGKYILVEFWRTWCGACRRMSPRMNELHRKYGDQLVVIAITGEPVDKVKAALPGWKKDYYLAIDKPRSQAATEAKDASTSAGKASNDDEDPDGGSEDSIFRPEEQGAYEAQFGVWGWPHVVLLEPKYRAVIWQGFPGLKGYELTVEEVGKYLERGRKAEKEGARD